MIQIDDITWEMYCEYLGVPFFEPFKLNFMYKDTAKAYEDFLICTLDRDYFLDSGFHKYLINKNRLDLINKILEE